MKTISTRLWLGDIGLLKIAAVSFHHSLKTVPESGTRITQCVSENIIEHLLNLGQQLGLFVAYRAASVLFNRVPYSNPWGYKRGN